jgi:MFS family permease
MTFGMSIGGFLELKLGFCLTTLSGLLIILACNIVFLNAQNIWLCYVLTFLMSSGAGISNSLTGKNLAFFKPGRKGLLVSVLAAITTAFAAVFSITGEKLINPDGYTLGEKEEYYDYKYSSRTYIYFTIGFFTIPIGVTLFLLFIIEYKKGESKVSEERKEESETNKEIKEEKENEKPEIINENENEDITGENNENEENENELILSKSIQEINKKHKIRKVIKTFRFWRLSISLFLATFSFSFILGTGRTFGALIGINGSALQYLMICQSGAMIVVGPLLGFFVDKKGPLIFLRIATVVLIIPGILLTFFTKNTIAFIVSFVVSVLGLVSSMVCIAPFMMDVYGIQESVILGGIMNVFAKIADVITTVVAFVISFFYNKEEILVPYRIMYMVGSGCCVVSFILLMFEKRDKFDYGDEDKEDLGDIVEKGRFTEINA